MTDLARSNDDPQRLSLLTAEFAAMRAEITTMLSLQSQFLNFSVALMGASITATVVLSRSSSSGGDFLQADFALPMSIAFSVLGILYEDATVRIFRAARYIEQYLHSAIERHVPNLDPDKPMASPLYWEKFIRDKKLEGSWFLRIGDVIRRFVFWVPALILLISSIRNNKVWTLFNDWGPFNWFFFILAVFTFLFDVVIYFRLFSPLSNGVLASQPIE